MFWALASAIPLALWFSPVLVSAGSQPQVGSSSRLETYGAEPMWITETPPPIVSDSVLGFQCNPDQVIHSVQRTANRLVWDKKYSINAKGIRATPQDGLKRRGKFAALTGDSFIFGVGLNDDETLAYYLGLRLAEFKVYNLGVPASATNMMLRRLQTGGLENALQEPLGVLIHIPIAGDIGRVNGFFTEMAWMRDTPYFAANESSELVVAGSLKSHFSWRYRIYDWIRTGLPWLHWNWPWFYSSKHILYDCALTVQAQKEFHRRFPDSRFLVVSHPLMPLPDQLNQCLREHHVEVWVPQMELQTADQIPIDGHPSAKFNRRFAELLAGHLR